MIDLSKNIEYMRSRPVFSRVSNDGLSIMAAVFRITLEKKGLDEDDFIYLVELYEKGYIMVVSDEENERMCIKNCSPEDAPQLNVKLN